MKYIPLDQIMLDTPFQLREKLDTAKVQEDEELLPYSEPPPIDGAIVGGTRCLVNGWHRYKRAPS